MASGGPLNYTTQIRSDKTAGECLALLGTHGEPAIAVITFACVHEHVDSAAACAGCAAEIQRIEDALICRKCESGPQPHDCAQVIRIRWLEASRG